MTLTDPQREALALILAAAKMRAWRWGFARSDFEAPKAIGFGRQKSKVCTKFAYGINGKVASALRYAGLVWGTSPYYPTPEGEYMETEDAQLRTRVLEIVTEQMMVWK